MSINAAANAVRTFEGYDVGSSGQFANAIDI
jgi:hypothetical protein